MRSLFRHYVHFQADHPLGLGKKFLGQSLPEAQQHVDRSRQELGHGLNQGNHSTHHQGTCYLECTYGDDYQADNPLGLGKKFRGKGLPKAQQRVGRSRQDLGHGTNQGNHSTHHQGTCSLECRGVY